MIGVIVDSINYYAAALPLDRVVAIGRSFLDWGVPALEWLGVKGTVQPDGAVLLFEVAEQGPADEHGLSPGDLMVAIDGEPLDGWDHLVHLIRESGVGTTISVEVLRDDETVIVSAVVGSRADRPSEN